MQIIVPVETTLAFTGSSPTYVYSLWATSTAYAKGAVVRYVTNSVSRDYLCKYAHTSSTYTYPTIATYYWTDVGISSTTGGYTYTTNARLSGYPTWACGAAVIANAIYYDSADNHDYQAVIAVSAGDNTTRPSEAVRSSTETLAARWIDMGVANAWAALDQQNNTYLEGYDTNNALLATLTATYLVNTAVAADAICIDGLYNCASLTITPTLGGVAQTAIVTAAPARSVVIPLATAKAAGTTLSLALSMTQSVATLPIRMGVLCVGTRVALSDTSWEVETSILSFSRKERNETYGTVTFVKRGSAKQVQATCFINTATISGDTVMQTLAATDGIPIFWDFNNTGADYARLRLFGFFTNLATVIKGSSFESLSLTVQGLVE